MAKPWREMDGEERIKAVLGLIVLVFGIVVFFAWLAASGDAERDQGVGTTEQQAAVAANDPVRFAKALVPWAEVTFESDRNPQTGMIDRLTALEVKFSIDPVPSSNRVARNDFFGKIAALAPAVFEKFPHTDVIVMRGTAKMVDIRGHESEDVVARISLARWTSAGINWQNVKVENIPIIADSYYLHPRLVSDLAPSDPVRTRSEKDVTPSARAWSREPQSTTAAAPAPSDRELGGEVDKFVPRFNAAAIKHESTVRLATHGCVRAAAVTCTYMLGNVGAVALASHGRPLGTLTWVFGADGDPTDSMMAMLLTMAVFAPNAPRKAIQQAYKDLFSAWQASADKTAEVVLEGVTYRLSPSPLGVLFSVLRR